jgi:hypothetical protein
MNIADKALQLLRQEEKVWIAAFTELVKRETQEQRENLSKIRTNVVDPYKEFNACCVKHLQCTSTSKPLQALLIELEDKHCQEPIVEETLKEFNKYKMLLWGIHLQQIEGFAHLEPNFWKHFIHSVTIDDLFSVPMWALHEDRLGGKHGFRVLVPDGYKLQLPKGRTDQLELIQQKRQALRDDLERKEAGIELFVQQCQEHAYRHVCELLTTATHDGHVPTLRHLLDETKQLVSEARGDPGTRITPLPCRDEFVEGVRRDLEKLQKIEDTEFCADLFQLMSFLQIRQDSLQTRIKEEAETFEALLRRAEMYQQYQDYNEAIVHVEWDDRVLVLIDKWLRLVDERLSKLEFPAASAIERETLSNVVHNSRLYFEAERARFQSDHQTYSSKRDDLAESVDDWRVKRAESALKLDLYYHRLEMTRVLKDKQNKLVSTGTTKELNQWRTIILSTVDSTKASPEDVMKFTAALAEDEENRNRNTQAMKKIGTFVEKVLYALNTLQRDVERITRTLENMKVHTDVAVRVPAPPFVATTVMTTEHRMQVLLSLQTITTRAETVIKQYTEHRQRHGSNVRPSDAFQRACTRMRRVFLAPENVKSPSVFYWENLPEIFCFITECCVQEHLFKEVEAEFTKEQEQVREKERRKRSGKEEAEDQEEQEE